MKTIKKLVIIGSGAIGMEALWLAEDMNSSSDGKIIWKILGFGDDDICRKGSKVQEYEVLGTTKELLGDLEKDVLFHCAIGNNKVRSQVVELIKSRGFNFATLIHPSVIFAKSASVGEGSFIGAGSIVAPMAKIGNFVLINTHVGIGHHSIIGDFSQICPGAKVNGKCKIDRLAFIGANASIQPGNSVGESATVCANSFAVREVKPNTLVSGVPARLAMRS